MNLMGRAGCGSRRAAVGGWRAPSALPQLLPWEANHGCLLVAFSYSTACRLLPGCTGTHSTGLHHPRLGLQATQAMQHPRWVLTW